MANASTEQLAMIASEYPDRFPGPALPEPAEAIWHLSSEATSEETVWVWGRNEPFPISTKGIPGAYLIDALEADPDGLFATIGEAREALELNHGMRELFDTEEACWTKAHELGWK
ncbi:MAG: hypothetical protein H6742_15405 [Alphaproteobacteria bacterium]|nr:hypothetical protein [Alphaproteobacteria bacterium]